MNGTNAGGLDDDPPRHPIGVVTARTGLSRHVLRAWEKRYGVVDPDRSEGGHRLYSDVEVHRLRLLHDLTEGGRRIGQIAHLSTAELAELHREDRLEAVDAAAAVDGGEGAASIREAALGAVGRFDSVALETILRRAALQLPAASLVDDVLVPTLREVGDAWERGELSPAQEHLATAVVVRTLHWMIDQYDPEADAEVFLAGTPAGEKHELGALLAAVTAAAEGWKVIHLGPDLPADELVVAVREMGARILALSIVGREQTAGAPDLEAELRALGERLPGEVELVVGGAGAASWSEVLATTGATLYASYGELRRTLRENRPGTGG